MLEAVVDNFAVKRQNAILTYGGDSAQQKDHTPGRVSSRQEDRHLRM